MGQRPARLHASGACTGVVRVPPTAHAHCPCPLPAQVAPLVEALVAKYVALSAEELEEWQNDPEGYIRCVCGCLRDGHPGDLLSGVAIFCKASTSCSCAGPARQVDRAGGRARRRHAPPCGRGPAAVHAGAWRRGARQGPHRPCRTVTGGRPVLAWLAHHAVPHECFHPQACPPNLR